MSDPAWKFLNGLVVAAIVLICSWSNASNFDETEIKLVGMFMVFFGGYEALKSWRGGDR